MSSRKIKQSEWSRIYSEMLRYNRTEGYVDLLNDKLTLFDSDPMLKGVHACHVTITDVKDYAGFL